MRIHLLSIIVPSLALCAIVCVSGCDSSDSAAAKTDSSENKAPAADKPSGDAGSADAAGADASAAAGGEAAAAFVPYCAHCKCEGDAIEATKDKGQQRCKLTEATEVQGYKVMPRELTFDAEGRMITFNVQGETTIDGVKCGDGYVVGLFGDGKLDYCFTSGEIVRDGVPCDGQISLRPDGTLSRCKLGKAHKFGELELPAGSFVSFWEGEGERLLDRFEVTEAVEVQGLKCKGYWNYLHEDGVKLRKCELDGEQKIEGKKYDSGAAVCFDKEGKLGECNLFTFRTTG